MPPDLKNWTPGFAMMGGPGDANEVTHMRSRISPDGQITWLERMYGDGRVAAVFTFGKEDREFATEEEARAALTPKEPNDHNLTAQGS